MKHLNQSQSKHHPDLFSRGTLELTFRLLRGKHPALALEIQNVLVNKLSNQRVQLPASNPQTGDSIYVDLEVSTINNIVTALTEMGKKGKSDDNSENGLRVVLSTLIPEWMALIEACGTHSSDKN